MTPFEQFGSAAKLKDHLDCLSRSSLRLVYVGNKTRAGSLYSRIRPDLLHGDFSQVFEGEPHSVLSAVVIHQCFGLVGALVSEQSRYQGTIVRSSDCQPQFRQGSF
jgi:hypothetical protein